MTTKSIDQGYVLETDPETGKTRLVHKPVAKNASQRQRWRHSKKQTPISQAKAATKAQRP